MWFSIWDMVEREWEKRKKKELPISVYEPLNYRPNYGSVQCLSISGYYVLYVPCSIFENAAHSGTLLFLARIPVKREREELHRY